MNFGLLRKYKNRPSKSWAIESISNLFGYICYPIKMWNNIIQIYFPSSMIIEKHNNCNASRNLNKMISRVPQKQSLCVLFLILYSYSLKQPGRDHHCLSLDLYYFKKNLYFIFALFREHTDSDIQSNLCFVSWRKGKHWNIHNDSTNIIT